jgi:hypothetical protein
MNDSEADAMWEIYATGINGVAVRSTVSRLKQCFHNSPQDISLGTISYSCADPAVRPHVDPDHIVRRCMRKRPAFKHEQEVRLVFYDEHRKHTGHAGIQIPIDVTMLIEKIVVSPRAENWFLSIVKTLVATLGYEIKVFPSDG